MLGSLLDQDEIEEFMAEADAVIMMMIMLLTNCLSVCNGKGDQKCCQQQDHNFG